VKIADYKYYNNVRSRVHLTYLCFLISNLYFLIIASFDGLLRVRDQKSSSLRELAEAPGFPPNM